MSECLRLLSTDAVRAGSGIWMSSTLFWFSAIGKETAERIIWFPCPPLAVIIFSTEFVTGLSTGDFFKIDRIFLEYRKRKRLNQVKSQLVQCLAKRMFPCEYEVKIAFSLPSTGEKTQIFTMIHATWEKLSSQAMPYVC